jgi:hypothetical protein
MNHPATQTQTQQEPRTLAPLVLHYVVKNNDIMEAMDAGHFLIRDIMSAILYPFNK